MRDKSNDAAPAGKTTEIVAVLFEQFLTTVGTAGIAGFNALEPPQHAVEMTAALPVYGVVAVLNNKRNCRYVDGDKL